jgi:hypothetical protein
MIEISGVREGDEFEAAKELERRLLRLWPDLARSKTDVVRMFVGLKMHGQQVEDLDLVVVGSFADPRPFAVEWQFYSKDGEAFTPRSARVRNFALIIEVKSHDATGVRFENTVAFVRYMRNGRGSEECVTEKNRTQMFKFKRWLDRFGLDRVHVQNLVLFTGLKERDLPKRPHVCIASDTSFERLLNVLGQVTRPWENDRRVTLTAGSEEVFEKLLAPNSPLFSRLEPTTLDRRRMDMIAKAALSDAWLADLGERQVLLKGRGGTGKTVTMLQMAYRAYDRSGQRSLVLTFNKALVSDMRRTMALLGVPGGVDSGGVSIETVHGFIGKLMLRLGVMDDYEAFLSAYAQNKAVLLDYIQSGTVSSADIAQARAAHAADFDWDLVFVDEGQDWPADEIALLKSVYGSERLVVSDGIDQFVRGSVADWNRDAPKGRVMTRRMRKCLRMKANLASFVADVAWHLGLQDWDLEPNSDAAGGRVIIFDGDLAAQPLRWTGLVEEAAGAGNSPVDLLACVPPAGVERTATGSFCPAEEAYVALGGKVWNGTDPLERELYPTDREQLRFVQYDSCRGLEGWAVINFDLDELWNYKAAQWTEEDGAFDPLLESAREAAERHAARWVMIPLTRAIDTLAIGLRPGESRLRTVLSKVAARHPDYVSWVDLSRAD